MPLVRECLQQGYRGKLPIACDPALDLLRHSGIVFPAALGEEPTRVTRNVPPVAVQAYHGADERCGQHMWIASLSLLGVEELLVLGVDAPVAFKLFGQKFGNPLWLT